MLIMNFRVAVAAELQILFVPPNNCLQLTWQIFSSSFFSVHDNSSLATHVFGHSNMESDKGDGSEVEGEED